MKHLVSRTGIIVAGSAATMSVVWAAFGPHGSPWLSVGLSLAWASLACVAVVWVVKGSVRLNRRLGDVISATSRPRLGYLPPQSATARSVDKSEALAEAPNQKVALPA